MHELSLAQGILDIVHQVAHQEQLRQIERLHLEVGMLSGVEISALRFAMENVALESILAHTQIVIHEVCGQAWCLKCNATREIHVRGDPCPACGSYWLQPTGGDQLRVVEIIGH